MTRSIPRHSGYVHVAGTPDYVAPELIKGEKGDAASDWWSLGICLYEFLIGIPPFHADTVDQVFDNISNQGKYQGKL